MSVELFHSIEAIQPTQWDLILPLQFPFLSYSFLHALEKSEAIGADSGWQPLYFVSELESIEGVLYTFEKTHSYGEYIFDWQWADAYNRHGHAYYPKLTSMIPFTPATTPHFVMAEYNQEVAHQLLDQYEAYYAEHEYSSSHFLFLPDDEIDVFRARDYLIRESLQYHFINDGYQSFDSFLDTIKGRKANQIRRERNFSGKITIKQFTGPDLTQDHAREMYRFYVATISKKQAIPYLRLPTFEQLFATMPQHILYVQACEDNEPIAGAIYFYDDARLYGRYWGCDTDYPNLHFELCYYQGMEFCINRQLSVFEAGAQGEHKIARGFWPVKTYSAHQIKDEMFREAIADYIVSEQSHLDKVMVKLRSRLPFKQGSGSL